MVGCGLVVAMVLWLWQQFGGCGGYFLGCCGIFIYFLFFIRWCWWMWVCAGGGCRRCFNVL